MRILTLIFLVLLMCTSCGSSKRNKIVTKKDRTSKNTSVAKRSTNENPSENTTADKIIDHAFKFEGVRYKYGGTTKKGMDCSGLITTAYKSENIVLPRTTADLSKTGDWIDLKTIQKGDLLFFATRKNSRKVNHVGIVTNITSDEVEFIHSTTSKGVITSKLSERYWYLAFVQARRIL